MRLFEIFWIEIFFPKGSPFNFFDVLQHNGCQKIAKGPPFTFSGTVTLFKNLIKFFLGNFFMSPKGPPFNFLKFFATSWSFTKPEGSPFQILSLRYGADFGRSRLVIFGYGHLVDCCRTDSPNKILLFICVTSYLFTNDARTIFCSRLENCQNSHRLVVKFGEVYSGSTVLQVSRSKCIK